jgi:hypothetical protein
VTAANSASAVKLGVWGKELLPLSCAPATKKLPVLPAIPSGNTATPTNWVTL